MEGQWKAVLDLVPLIGLVQLMAIQMADNREAFYSTNVVMEAEAIMYLNYTQDKLTVFGNACFGLLRLQCEDTVVNSSV